MLIDNRFYAPHFGCWNLTTNILPPMGEVVLGLLWGRTNGCACTLMEWRVVEEPDDYLEEAVFVVRDRSSQYADQFAAWFPAFPDEDDEEFEEALLPPMIWCEARFVIQTPLSVCEQCDGIKEEGDDECDGGDE